ncbi:MFS transporter [Tropicimonas sp. IMCC34043]|uniref:MFS transporter n=1 Tax=Tropicimonas sp. IMCC34043 TaxID=2248760 RepID=UPI001E50B50B|nr:MFS transporter [Tropicimonas sp. IMCC34043]
MSDSTFAPLKYPAYRALLGASLVANLGVLVQGVGAGWLMTSLTDDAGMVALVQGSQTLPLAVLSLLGGVLADSFERRSVMLLAQIFMLAMAALLAGLAALQIITPWSLLAFTFAISCGTAIRLPSWQASVGDLVPREHLPQAVMLNGMGFNLMRSVGPAVGGVIVALWGAGAAFTITAVGFAPMLYTLANWRPASLPDPLPREPLGASLRVGLRYASLSTEHLKIMMRGAIFGFGAVSFLALLPLVARDMLQGTASTYGLILGFFGVGAVGAAMSLRRLRERFDTETIVRIAFLCLAVALPLTGLSRSVWLTGVAGMIAGFAWQCSMALFNIAVQLSTPRWVLGRIISVLQVFTFTGMSLGSWLWGEVATRFAVPEALFGAAAVCLLGGLLGLVVRLPEEGRDNLEPHNGAAPPVPALDIDMRSGPIKVQVEYIVPDEKTEAFLELMARRRVIRQRDGALGWSLYRDLAEPERWHESYRAATWAGYLRHLARRTTTDAENYKLLVALLGGDPRAKARRWIERPPDPRQLHARRDETP